MKFSSKLVLAAAASVLSVSAFADIADFSTYSDLSASGLTGYIQTDTGIAALGTAGGAYIVQAGAGGVAVIGQDQATGNTAYIAQQSTLATAAEAVIYQSGTGNFAVINQK